MLFSLIVILLLGTMVVLVLKDRLMMAAALLVLLLYLDVSDIGIRYHGWPSVAQPLVLVFAVIAFARGMRAGESRSLAAGAGFWSAAAIYLAVVLASSIWAVDGGAAAHQASNLAKDLLVVYVIAELFQAPEGQRLVTWALIAGGALLATLSVVQALTHTYGSSYLGFAQADVRQIVGATTGYRSAGPIGDPNFYGLMLAAVVPLAVLRLWHEERRSLRAAGLASAILLVVGVGLTYSRGALIALVVAFAGLVLAMRLDARKLLVGGVVVLGLAIIAPSNYVQRFTSLGHEDHSFRGHVGSQNVALAMFADHPVLGVGANNYQATYFPYAQELHTVDAASTVHDLYLATAAETGLIGLLAFGLAIVALVRGGWRRRAAALRARDASGAALAAGSLLALVIYLVGSLFLPLAYPRYLWIFAGLLLSVSLPSRLERGVVARAPAIGMNPS